MNVSLIRAFSSTSKNAMKDKLLKKISRVARAKENQEKVQHIEKALKIDYNDKDDNQRILSQLFETFGQEKHENEYIKLIERMRDLKQQEDKKGDSEVQRDQVERVMQDFIKEQEDKKVGEEAGVRLIRPPKTVKEALNTLKEADERYDSNKGYLYGSAAMASGKLPKRASDGAKTERADPLENVPKGITLQRLYYPPSKSEIILVGVKQRVVVHSSFVYDLLQEMRPESIFVQLPPDNPLFIRNPKTSQTGEVQSKYREQWFRFLKRGLDASFLISPRPKFTSDVILQGDKLKRLFEDNIIPATDEFEVGTNAVYSQTKRTMDLELKADAFLTPLLYAYNNHLNRSATTGAHIQVIVGDMPKVVHRELAGRRFRVQECQEMFRETIRVWEDTQQGAGLSYDPEVSMHNKVLVEPRVEYMGELLRQVAHVSRRVVAIVDDALIPNIEDKWQKLPRDLRSLETLLQVKKPEEKKHILDVQETWLEFIEKQVIMDSLFEPFIWKNYVQYKSFPYEAEGFLGKETAMLNLFTFWDHYQSKYTKEMKRAAILEEEFDRHMREEGYDIKSSGAPKFE
ncbi:hypothetical protein FGO68_gene107 [Halteria grandinella]|uniref:Uncharacterized protein n=1 Tax=Halteria grandinella TaxID=5974 RepID=A0A8J8NSG0_HALGN|nr:hypothetical protein FGO68_gene107 [Halteria grandinella]